MHVKLKTIQSIKDITTIISFITGIITLISTLLVLQVPTIKPQIIFTKIEINTSYLFAFWLIIFFTYFVFLHSFWLRKRGNPEISNDFFDFFFDIFTTPIPQLMLPLFILIIIMYLLIPIFLSIIITFIVFFLLASYYQSSTRKVNSYMSNYWLDIKNRIELELSRNQWISENTLKDISHKIGVEPISLEPFLIQYAVDFPDMALFRSVYDVEDYQLIAEDVLISIANFDYERYYHE